MNQDEHQRIFRKAYDKKARTQGGIAEARRRTKQIQDQEITGEHKKK